MAICTIYHDLNLYRGSNLTIHKGHGIGYCRFLWGFTGSTRERGLHRHPRTSGTDGRCWQLETQKKQLLRLCFLQLCNQKLSESFVNSRLKSGYRPPLFRKASSWMVSYHRHRASPVKVPRWTYEADLKCLKTQRFFKYWMCIYICISLHTYIYTYIYIYIRTYIYI